MRIRVASIAAALLGLVLACSSSSSDSDSSSTDARCGSNTKTVANRYLCLPEGARCATSTLPCCTDECESNDGQLFNPSNDPSKYLTCDRTADKCATKSAGGANQCKAITPSTLYDCPAGELQCGIRPSGDGGPAGGLCCPKDKPFSCYGVGSECFADADSANQFCHQTYLTCAACVDASAVKPTCDAAGTWTIACPASSTSCGACGTIPAASVQITVPSNVAQSGGTFTEQGVSVTFDKATCSLSYTVTCGRKYSVHLDKGTVDTTYVCASGCVQCGAAKCTATKN